MTMKPFALLTTIFLMFMSSAIYANTFEEEKAMQLAESGVSSKNANGESQTTMVDANGNLKIVPLDKNGKPIDPNTVAPEDNAKNNSGQQNQNARPQ